MHWVNVAAMGFTMLMTGCDTTQTVPNAMGYAGRDCSAYRPYVWTEARPIPDGDRRGTLIGPLCIENDEPRLGEVELAIDISHPCTSDLEISLAYDADGDGNPEARAPVEFHRSRPAFDAEQRNAVSPSLAGTYYFRDGAEEYETAFAGLRELPRGHAFYLAVADTAGTDAGSVERWAVYLPESGAIVQR